jgi:dTDP-4-amino-4,6-dideoxygalactose transaminase
VAIEYQRTEPDLRLARDGGPAAVTGAVRPMFPGGMEVGDEELRALERVIRSRNLFRYYGVGDGPQEVDAFEREFAEHMGATYALCVNAGSSGLICGLIASGVGPGDEVVVPAYTWNATANAVLATGALPVLAEVDESLTLDPVDVERRITSRTRALLPVHMRGNAANMRDLVDLARRHELVLVEDACQAAGASFEGRRLGSFGDAGAYSLQFNKIITTGEGGVMITSRPEVHELAIEVHDCAGPVRRGEGLPRFPGFNFRASELTAAVGRVQLTRLDSLLARMRAHHARLATAVEQLPGLTLRRSNDAAGDAGIALIAFAESAALAHDAVEALQAEGVAAMQIYSPDVVDLHVYPFWRPVLEAIRAAGRPAPDCPRTIDLVGRAVHVDVPPLLDERDLEEIELALRKVALGVLA